MRKISGRLSVCLVAVGVTTALFMGCAGETHPDPPAQPAEVQKLRGDQATDARSAADARTAEPAPDASDE